MNDDSKKKVVENLNTIRKIAGGMRDDKDLSENAKGKADRIDALAEQCLAAVGEEQKEGGQ